MVEEYSLVETIYVSLYYVAAVILLSSVTFVELLTCLWGYYVGYKKINNNIINRYWRTEKTWVKFFVINLGFMGATDDKFPKVGHGTFYSHLVFHGIYLIFLFGVLSLILLDSRSLWGAIGEIIVFCIILLILPMEIMVYLWSRRVLKYAQSNEESL